MFHTGILGGAYRRCCLLELVGTLFPKIGDQKNAISPFECSLEGFRTVQIRFDDFVGESAMLAGIAGQSARLELAAGLQRTYDSASLLPGGADDGDQVLIARCHVDSFLD